MNAVRYTQRALVPLGIIAGFPALSFACSVCYGKTDSLMTKGLNGGIMTLLVIVLLVLGGFASFFLQVLKKSKQT